MDDDVEAILTGTRTWAVVGCSPDPGRDSHRIAALLQERGFRVIPVNPAEEEILGERWYPSVTAIPRDLGVEGVDVFRRSDAAGRHVDEAISSGAVGVWLQVGGIDQAGAGLPPADTAQPAADRASAAGLKVVMDRCPAIEFRRLAVRA